MSLIFQDNVLELCLESFFPGFHHVYCTGKFRRFIPIPNQGEFHPAPAQTLSTYVAKGRATEVPSLED